jgi:serine/threonine protein kinase
MEYAAMGALDQYIETIEDIITVAHREAILQQICAGMEALADARLIHRDLALRNILVFAFSADDVSKTSVKVYLSLCAHCRCQCRGWGSSPRLKPLRT